MSALETDEVALLERTGELLGSRMAAAAQASGGASASAARLSELLEDLVDADFIEVSEGGVSPTAETAFLVIGGRADPPLYEAEALTNPLSTALAGGDLPVVVSEPLTSEWDLVDGIRDEGDAREIVGTVDQADTVPGRIAIALALDFEGERGPDEPSGHWGTEDDATAILPPVPGLAD